VKLAPKPVKLSDEKGQFLLVQPSGGKLWRLKYRIDGKEKKPSLGRYPDPSLKDAWERCSEARKLIAAGGEPPDRKRQNGLEAQHRAATTFKAVADEHRSCGVGWRPIARPEWTGDLLTLPRPSLPAFRAEKVALRRRG
jgi:hypothetical protein